MTNQQGTPHAAQNEDGRSTRLANRTVIGARSTFIIAASIGLWFATYLYSATFLGGSTSSFIWPRGDFQTYMVATKLFYHSPWTYPLFDTSLLERSLPQSLVYTDFVPAAALLGKSFFKLTGIEVYHIPIWYFLVALLQTVSFAALLWVIGIRSIMLITVGVMLASLNPALLYRVGHTPLMGHFLIIFAIALYFVTIKAVPITAWWKGPTKWWAALVPLAALCNLYLFLMVFAFFGAALLDALASQRFRRASVRSTVTFGAIITASTLAAMFISGYFLPYSGGGTFGFHSMNILSPIYPQISGVLPGFEKVLDINGGQYEGFNYFGLGILLVMGVAIKISTFNLFPEFRTHVFLYAALACLVALAVTNVGYFGAAKLWSLPEPPGFGAFRSSGRLFWPVTYFLLAFALRSIDINGWKIRHLGLLLSAAVVLQWADSGRLVEGLRSFGHNTTRPANIRDAELFRPIIANHKGVFVRPDYHCPSGKAGNDIIGDIAWFAAVQTKPLNTLYFARAPKDHNCDIDAAQMAAKAAEGYFVVAVYDKNANVEKQGGACAIVEDVPICVASTRQSFTPEQVQQLFKRY